MDECGKCGSALTKTVILGNEFVVGLNHRYHDRFVKRREAADTAVDLHSMVDSLHPSNMELDYKHSVYDCFEHLADSAKDGLSREHRDYIKEKRDRFLDTGSKKLDGLICEFKKSTESILHSVPNVAFVGDTDGVMAIRSLLGLQNVIDGIKMIKTKDNKRRMGLAKEMLKRNVNMAADALKIVVTHGTAAINMIQDEIAHALDPKNKEIIEDWKKTREQIKKELESQWKKLLELVLNDIPENTPIRFDVDMDAVDEQLAGEISFIEQILENHLKPTADFDAFCFCQNIPSKKKAGAKNSYVKICDDDEKIICLHDSTVKGGAIFDVAEKGICLTTKAVYWKSLGKNGKSVNYCDIKDVQISDDRLTINDVVVKEASGELAKKIKLALNDIVVLLPK